MCYIQDKKSLEFYFVDFTMNTDLFSFFATEHPIHPPPTKGDPFKVDFQEPVGYVLKMEEGVMHVYCSQEDADRGTRMEWLYPDLQSFLKDHALMQTFIADGPL